MPRRLRDFGVAVLALAALFVALAGIDDRVPGEVSQIAGDAWYGRWVQPGTDLGDLIMRITGSQAFDNFFLAAFLGAAAVLVFLMVKT